MFIDEMARELNKSSQLVSKLRERRNKILKQINQKVYIRDLVLRTSSHHHGEAGIYKNPYAEPTQDRLIAHIKSLFSLANEDHRANYCDQNTDGTFQLKQGKENHVTRLTMNEFALYTNEPLSTIEFDSLMTNIERMAQQLEPNVHVLLSSFALRTKAELLNMCVFIEGGNPPIINAFAKNTASDIDIDYSKKELLFSQQKRATRVSFHANHINVDESMTVSTGSVFEVRTQGGACYTQTFDVCLDHASQHSKELMRRRILTDADPDELLPAQIEQCITSHAIDIYSKSIISTQFVHADPISSMQTTHRAVLGTRVLDAEAKNRIIPNGYNQMALVEHPLGYALSNPAFGSDCLIEVLKERPAGEYTFDLKHAINQHNQKTVTRRALSLAPETCTNDSIPPKSEWFRLDKITALETSMLEQCKPTFWQRVFRTEEYKQKTEAKKIVSKSFQFIKETIKTDGTNSIFIVRSWKKELDSRLNYIGGNLWPSPLKTKLKNELKNYTDQLQQDLKCEFTPSTPNPTGYS